MKKISSLLIALAIIPAVAAEGCGITNFVTCIPQKIAEFILMLFNAPIIPLLSLIKNLLGEPVAISIFKNLWSIVIYIISLFYGLFFLFSGFNFIVSGYNAEKRARAKEWLKNTLLMIFFVQASYLIYSLINDVASLLASSILNLIDEHFFLLTADSLVNLGLSILLSFVYISVLAITVILLGLRYILVAGGVIIFPFGLFLYFIPPLRDYGKLILNTVGVLMFVPFFISIQLLIASKLLDISVFTDFKIILMIAGFTMANLTMLFLLFFALIKSALSLLKSDMGHAVKAGIKYLI